MQNEPVWLPADEVIAINQREVLATGEPHAVLSVALLESACAKPANRWAYEDDNDLPSLAVALLFGIARNHTFQQGNKRTAFVAAIMFLNYNGLDLVAPDSLAERIVQVIERSMSEAEFVDYIRPFVVPLDL